MENKYLTDEETLQLNRELLLAKIPVLVKWGFSVKEISNIVGLTESDIREYQNTSKQKAESR